MKKTVLLIGLGRYGRHTARMLHELGHEILAVDKDEERVNMVLPYVTNALVADSTVPQFLESLGPRDFDLCLVAIGDDDENRLFGPVFLGQIAMHADEVVYPEKQLANWTAMRYGYDHILDYFQLSDKYGVYELDVPQEWQGHTIGELNIRQKYHVNILGIKKGGHHLVVEMTPQTEFRAGDTVLLVGSRNTLQKFFHI